jgi:large subunit ribosomal protein L30
MTKRLKIRRIHSGMRRDSRQRKTLRALGLARLYQEVELPDNPQIRGMIMRVRHLVDFTEIES